MIVLISENIIKTSLEHGVIDEKEEAKLDKLYKYYINNKAGIQNLPELILDEVFGLYGDQIHPETMSKLNDFLPIRVPTPKQKLLISF